MSRGRGLALMRRLLRWLNRNSAAVTAVATLVQAIGVIAALYYAAATIAEGNRIAWRTFIDTREAELGKSVIDRDVLRCGYHYGLRLIDDDCAKKLYDGVTLGALIEYVIQEISNLEEAKIYSDSEDPGYYDSWYAEDAHDLSGDPTGIVSFVLWEDFGCTSKEHCEIATQLDICIKDEQFTEDKQHCFDNLAAKRKRFMERVGGTTIPITEANPSSKTLTRE
jgi:hypothetical protein